MTAAWMDDEYIDVCVRMQAPSGIAGNADLLKKLPPEVRPMVVRDGRDLINESTTYREGVRLSALAWLEVQSWRPSV